MVEMIFVLPVFLFLFMIAVEFGSYYIGQLRAQEIAAVTFRAVYDDCRSKHGYPIFGGFVGGQITASGYDFKDLDACVDNALSGINTYSASKYAGLLTNGRVIVTAYDVDPSGKVKKVTERAIGSGTAATKTSAPSVAALTPLHSLMNVEVILPYQTLTPLGSFFNLTGFPTEIYLVNSGSFEIYHAPFFTAPAPS